MLVKRVHPDMTIDANPSTSSMKTPEEPKPGSATFDGVFEKLFYRSRLWEQIDSPSFELMWARLQLLVGSHFDRWKAEVRTHPQRLQHQLILKCGPSTATSFIKSMEFMKKDELTERSSTEIGGSVSAGAKGVLLPVAIAARADVQARLGIRWTNESTKAEERRFRVEYSELPNRIRTPRSALLFLIQLQQAIDHVKKSTPEDARRVLLGDVLAEAETKLNSR
jgi:hypothetical protein